MCARVATCQLVTRSLDTTAASATHSLACYVSSAKTDITLTWLRLVGVRTSRANKGRLVVNNCNPQLIGNDQKEFSLSGAAALPT